MVIHSKLTVFFDQAFYRGVFERWTPTSYQVARVTFGTQPPSAPQLQQVIWRRWSTLQWTTPAKIVVSETHHRVKQRQRAAQRELKQHGARQRATVMLKTEHRQNLQLKKQRQRQARVQHAAVVRQKQQAKRLAKRRGH
ncbi:YjdF family protein [Levilactobacillus brevis]|nr:YjdF family protein [Levilactobacillus brevis]